MAITRLDRWARKPTYPSYRRSSPQFSRSTSRSRSNSPAAHRRPRLQLICGSQLPSRPSGSSVNMASIQINLPPITPELKNVSPYISRAQELKAKEPIIAYYCLLHATQTGIAAKEKESKAFLMSLMTILEKMKDQLKDHKEISNDPAAATYIENFAIKVFSNADNEDRKGGSSRSTAKKFLAASNFFELLSMFDDKYLNPNVLAEEKIKYSKWKAADIAKAYREGRSPHPGPMGYGSGDESGGRPITPHSDLEDASIGYSKSGTTMDGRASPNFTDSNESAAAPQSSSKPPLHNTDSGSSTQTLAPPRSSMVTPKHISTTSTMPSPYVVDLSSPASSTGMRTPFKSPGFSDGAWSTAATPGLESPNMFAAYGAGLVGKPGIKVHPANLALLNAMKSISPTSPMQRSPLGGNVITAASGIARSTDQKNSEEGVDTDEEDGQWSTAGNDPFSRQNSMMPLSSGPSFSNAHAGPNLVVTSNLTSVQEESTSKPAKGSDAHTIPTTQVLMVPLPPSASNSASSSPQLRPDSVTFAAQQPLPPILPPATQTPSSIKSDSHALPQGGLDDPNFKYTTSIVGDSMSDGETNYHTRRRSNSVSAGQKNAGNLATAGSGHVRAASINALASPPSKDDTPTPTNGLTTSASAPPSSTRGRLSPEEEDWERSSLSRLARLPDNRSGEDISGRLRGLGNYDSSSSASPPPEGDLKSRRNTLRAGSAAVSNDLSGFKLPGVPSAPPIDDWVNHTDKKSGGSGGSDSDGSGGDFAARLPSAPPFLPTVQDQMPHVTVFTKPASPRDELRVNPYFQPNTPNASVGSSQDAESPITPKNPLDRRVSTTPSYTNGIGWPNTANTINHVTTPSSASTSSTHHGYTPPNSVVSPDQGSTMPTASVSPPPGPMYHRQVFSSPPPPPVPQAGAYFPPQYSQPAAPSPAAPIYYSNQVPTNGITPHRDEFGLEISGRPPPSEVEPEVLGKVQKHAKYALSALNFEDLDTAREELKKALRLLY